MLQTPMLDVPLQTLPQGWGLPRSRTCWAYRGEREASPAPAKSPAQRITLAGETALIPLELEIIFIIGTQFLKPFSDI